MNILSSTNFCTTSLVTTLHCRYCISSYAQLFLPGRLAITGSFSPLAALLYLKWGTLPKDFTQSFIDCITKKHAERTPLRLKVDKKLFFLKTDFDRCLIPGQCITTFLHIHTAFHSYSKNNAENCKVIVPMKIEDPMVVCNYTSISYSYRNQLQQVQLRFSNWSLYLLVFLKALSLPSRHNFYAY